MPLSSVNMTLRKVTRNHRIFPSDEAVYKVVAPFHAQSGEEVDDADPRLETGAQSVCDRMWGAVPSGILNTPLGEKDPLCQGVKAQE